MLCGGVHRFVEPLPLQQEPGAIQCRQLVADQVFIDLAQPQLGVGCGHDLGVDLVPPVDLVSAQPVSAKHQSIAIATLDKLDGLELATAAALLMLQHGSGDNLGVGFADLAQPLGGVDLGDLDPDHRTNGGRVDHHGRLGRHRRFVTARHV